MAGLSSPSFQMLTLRTGYQVVIFGMTERHPLTTQQTPMTTEI